MSLNKNSGVGVALYQGELIHQDKKNVEVNLKKASHSCEHLKGTKHGHAYLTNFRLIFMCTSKNDMLRELSMPFKQIKDFEIKQPVFGANFLTGKLLAEPDGGWEGSVIFEMYFKDGGAITIGQKLVQLATNPQPQLSALSMHIYNGVPHPAYAAPQPQPYAYGGGYPTTQPAYVPQQGVPMPGSSNSYYFAAPAQQPPPPPAYVAGPPAPPGYTPPANSAAYSGPPVAPTTAPPSHLSPSEQAKYQEAMSQQQQGSSNLPPHYQDGENPPSYNDATKKDQ